jgi:hypothetical protein
MPPSPEANPPDFDGELATGIAHVHLSSAASTQAQPDGEAAEPPVLFWDMSIHEDGPASDAGSRSPTPDQTEPRRDYGLRDRGGVLPPHTPYDGDRSGRFVPSNDPRARQKRRRDAAKAAKQRRRRKERDAEREAEREEELEEGDEEEKEEEKRRRLAWLMMLDSLAEVSRRHNGDSEILTLFFGQRSLKAAEIAATIPDYWGERVEAELVARAIERGGHVLRPRGTGDGNAQSAGSGPYIKDPAGEHENLANHPEARGCVHCRVHNEMCPLRQDPRETWPCWRCDDEKVECELLVPVGIKGTCTYCRKKRFKCSYVEKGSDHTKPCAVCEQNGFNCVAGPPGGEMPARPTYDYMEAKKNGESLVIWRGQPVLQKRPRIDAIVDDSEEPGEDQYKEPVSKRPKSDDRNAAMEAESNQIEDENEKIETTSDQIDTVMESVEGNEGQDTLNQESSVNEGLPKRSTEDEPSRADSVGDSHRSSSAFEPPRNLTPEPSEEIREATTKKPKKTKTSKKSKRRQFITQDTPTPDPTPGPSGTRDSAPPRSPPPAVPAPPKRSGNTIQFVQTDLEHPLTFHEGALPPGTGCNWCRHVGYGLISPPRRAAPLRVVVSADQLTWTPVPTAPIAGATHPAVTRDEERRIKAAGKAAAKAAAKAAGKKGRGRGKGKGKEKAEDTPPPPPPAQPPRQPGLRGAAAPAEVGSHMCARHALAAGGIALCPELAATGAHDLRRIDPPPLDTIPGASRAVPRRARPRRATDTDDDDEDEDEDEEDEEDEDEDDSDGDGGGPAMTTASLMLLATRAGQARARLERNARLPTDVWCRVCVFPATYECATSVAGGWQCALKLCEACERELRENGRGDWRSWIARRARRRVGEEARAADRRDLELLAEGSLLAMFLEGD